MLLRGSSMRILSARLPLTRSARLRGGVEPVDGSPTGAHVVAHRAAVLAGDVGIEGKAGACQLLDRLGTAREFVANEFDALLHDGQAPLPARGTNGCKTCGNGKPLLAM